MDEEFYQSFLNHLTLVNFNFYWERELDDSGQWIGLYTWGLKNRIEIRGFKNFREVVNSVSKHILIVPLSQ